MPCKRMTKCGSIDLKECHDQIQAFVNKHSAKKYTYKTVLDYNFTNMTKGDVEKICTSSLFDGDIAAMVFAGLFVATIAVGVLLYFLCVYKSKPKNTQQEYYSQA